MQYLGLYRLKEPILVRRPTRDPRVLSICELTLRVIHLGLFEQDNISPKVWNWVLMILQYYAWAFIYLSSKLCLILVYKGICIRKLLRTAWQQGHRWFCLERHSELNGGVASSCPAPGFIVTAWCSRTRNQWIGTVVGQECVNPPRLQ